MGIVALVFLEGALVVNTCIQVEYAGVVHEKLERWSKLSGTKVFSALKRVGWVKLCIQLKPDKRMHIYVSYSYLFLLLLRA